MFEEAQSPEVAACGAPPPPSPAGPPPPASPRPQPSMAFTIDLDEGKVIDTQRYENLVKKSFARHQRVHSMSAGVQRHSATPAPSPSPATPPHPRKPPMSAKLPRRLQGYHSEGYFSSDQEDLNRSFSKQPSPGYDRPKPFDFKNSKSPIVDSIMSRSDTLPSRRSLNLPLKHPHTASLNRVTPELSPDCVQSYAVRTPHFKDHNLTDAPLIADTSSPELDLLTPDNVQFTPGTPSRLSLRRGSSGGLSAGRKSDIAKSPNLTINQQNVVVENDGDVSPSSTVSEAGTYTIEADNYTEEQKAKMNIDEAFCVDDFTEPIRQALDKIQNSETPPKEVNEIPMCNPVITKEPRSANFVSNIREELLLAKTIPDPIRKVSTDKNVLEISCCYESPTESQEPPHTGKPVKSAKNYLDKIKSRMKNISEKTFQKSPKTPEASVDVGSFTSVTASGVLGSMKQKLSKPEESSNRIVREKFCRKNSLTKSQIDSNEYVHYIPRDNLVLQKVTNDSFTPSQEKNACDDSFYESDNSYNILNKTPEQILVSKLSHLSLNRCKGDKSWIQEWADSVKKHNKEIAIGPTDVGLPPISPRHSVFSKGVSSPVKSGASSSCNSPTKIPSPVGTLVRQRAPVPDILTSTPDTESYLQSTQNVISNLQAKLQNAKSTPLSNLEISQNYQDKYITSKLPVSQLNRSNSLNYRLYRKNNSAENSPLRNPGNYLVTGTHGLPSSTRYLLSNLGTSKSLDTDPNLSPNGRYVSSHKKSITDNDVLVGRLQIENVGGSRTHMRHHSFDGRNAHEYFNDPDQNEDDFNNANMTQSLNLKTNNSFHDSGERSHRKSSNGQKHLIDSTVRNVLSPSNQRLNTVKLSHHRGLSDTYATNNTSNKSHRLTPKQDTQSSPIRRSSSFNVVNKNNNIYSLGSPVARVSSAGKSRNLCHRPQDRLMQTSCDFSARNNTPEMDCMSEDSDNLSTGGFYSDYDRRSMRKTGNDLLAGARYNRAFILRRARLESPDARVQHNNSPRCPSTPEMKRKFPNEPTKRPARSHSRDSRSIGPVGRMTDARPDVCQVTVSNTSKNQKNKKISDTSKQVPSRLTRSTSAAKDLTPKLNDKTSKKNKPSNPTVTSKEIEFTNWKKRASYDPMKAAQEGKKNKAIAGKVKLSDIVNSSTTKIEDISSPSNSSPVHRSQSFNCTGTPIDERIYLLQNQIEGSSDTDDFEDRLICTLPADGSTNVPILKMISAADANPEILLAKALNVPDVTRRTQPVQNSKVKLSTDYIAKLQVNPNDQKKILADKRRTYLINDSKLGESDSLLELDRRRTIVLDSDTTTNSTTNGSGSRRNSSVYSDERGNNERLSDSDVESDTEPITNVVHRVKSRSVPPQQRHSGDFSMSSSTCSGNKDVLNNKKPIQPRYLDISRYKSNDSSAKNFLRRDPSKTYVGVLPSTEHKQSKKITAKQLEQEQKTKELEKWKRRASYDPRKSAAQAKAKPVSTKSPSNSVLRSQSFHGPMMPTTKMSVATSDRNAPAVFYQDASSDNDF